jgi:hypothetical protein
MHTPGSKARVVLIIGQPRHERPVLLTDLPRCRKVCPGADVYIARDALLGKSHCIKVTGRVRRRKTNETQYRLTLPSKQEWNERERGRRSLLVCVEATVARHVPDTVRL